MIVGTLSPMIRSRRALATTATAAMLLYVGGGHSSGARSADHEGMAKAEIGICLVFVAFLIVSAFPQPALRRTPVHAYAPESPLTVSEVRRRPDGRSRASPTRLQRFRN